MESWALALGVISESDLDKGGSSQHQTKQLQEKSTPNPKTTLKKSSSNISVSSPSYNSSPTKSKPSKTRWKLQFNWVILFMIIRRILNPSNPGWKLWFNWVVSLTIIRVIFWYIGGYYSFILIYAQWWCFSKKIKFENYITFSFSSLIFDSLIFNLISKLMSFYQTADDSYSHIYSNLFPLFKIDELYFKIFNATIEGIFLGLGQWLLIRKLFIHSWVWIIISILNKISFTFTTYLRNIFPANEFIIGNVQPFLIEFISLGIMGGVLIFFLRNTSNLTK